MPSTGNSRRVERDPLTVNGPGLNGPDVGQGVWKHTESMGVEFQSNTRV